MQIIVIFEVNKIDFELEKKNNDNNDDEHVA
jgi:hypothetical protein